MRCRLCQKHYKDYNLKELPDSEFVHMFSAKSVAVIGCGSSFRI
jgi:hypothetical protein